MSSHHFVRDKQEPLLIVQSLSSELMELLVQLLEWSPEVIVFQSDKNLALLESYDLQPDWIYDREQKKLTNTYTEESHFNIDEHLEVLSSVLNYQSYNTIIACPYSNYKNLTLNETQEGLIKVVLTDALIQCCKNQYKKWLPVDTQVFIKCGKLKCLNIDLNQKNIKFTSKRESEGFNIFLKYDFLLDLSFDADFNVVEFF